MDTAHGGIYMRHLLGNGHLKKVVASRWPELGAVDVDKAAAELAVRLPGCYTKLRKQETTQFKACQKRKEAATRLEAAVQVMTDPGPAARTVTTPQPVTPQAFPAFTPAAMGAAIAGGGLGADTPHYPN